MSFSRFLPSRKPRARCCRCCAVRKVRHYQTDDWSVDLCPKCAREVLTDEGPGRSVTTHKKGT